MKRKILTLLLAVTAIIFCILPLAACDSGEFLDAGSGYYLASYGNKKDKEIIIPSTHKGKPVTSINPEAFKDFTNLERVVIPDTIDDISFEAFSGCTALKEINIPDSVKSFGGKAFYGCSSLTEITIPDGTKLGNEVFYGCTALTNITVKGSIVNVGSNVLTNTAYYNDDSNWENDLLYFENFLMNAKTTITGTVEVKENTVIAGYAFENCVNLEKVILPEEKIYSIAYGTFSGCEKLSYINLPDGLELISSYAFYGCKSLAGITLPDTITQIGLYAFYGCTSLETINIPKNMYFLGNYAFGGRNKDVNN